MKFLYLIWFNEIYNKGAFFVNKNNQFHRSNFIKFKYFLFKKSKISKLYFFFHVTSKEVTI